MKGVKDSDRTINRTICTMMRLQMIVLAVLLCIVPPGASAEEVTEPVYIPTKAQKGVRTSTDVILVALPAAAVATTIILEDWEGLKEGAFSAAATLGATLILKYAVRERRPDYSNHHSFPSGHASVTFAAATFIGRRYGWKYSIPAYALSAYTAWGRVYGKKHHWWDVAVGAAIGAASSLIFTHPYLQKHEFAVVPVATSTDAGIACSFTF